MKVIVPKPIMAKIKALVHATPDEFTLFGKTKYVDGDVHLVDFRIPKQRSHKSTTEVSEQELNEFLEELMDAGEEVENWNMWIHSHNTMGAFWSGQDKTQMQSFNIGPSWFCHMVVSTTGQRAAITQYKPFPLECDDVTIEIVEPEMSDAEAERMMGLELRRDAVYREYCDLTRQIEGTVDIDSLQAELKEKNKGFIVESYGKKWGNNNKKFWEEDDDYDTTYWKKKKPAYTVSMEEVDDTNRELKKLLEKTKKHSAVCVCAKCLRVVTLEAWLTDNVGGSQIEL